MLISQVTPIGWLHAIASLIALASGAYVLIARKGTARHRFWGWWFVGAMVTLNLSAFFIYRFDVLPGRIGQAGAGIFGLFHWFAVVSLGSTLLATFSAMRQRGSAFWSHVHAQSMLITYYGLLGGLLNEMFARIVFLRELAFSISPRAHNILQTLLLQLLQNGLTLIWLGLMLYFLLKVAKAHRRPRPSFTIGHPLRYSGGVFSGCIGLGGIAGAFAGTLGLGFMLGALAGLLLSVKLREQVEPIWGTPSPQQQKVRRLVIGGQIAIFMLLGGSGFFQKMPPLVISQAVIFIIGSSFLAMRWSHGPLMTWLGVSVLAWLGAGMALQLPVPLLAIGDGLLKIGFGLTMVEPLLTATRPLQSPTFALMSEGVAPASRSEASVTA